MRNIQDIVLEVMERRSLDEETRTELKGAAGQVHRPSLFDYWVGVRMSPIVKSTPDATVIGYEILEQTLGWKGWKPAVQWRPTEVHMQTYNRDGNLENYLVMLHKEGELRRISLTEYAPMPKIEGPIM